MRAMHTDDLARTQARLDDLEVKSAFTEDLVDRLNEVIVRQQRQIDDLARELQRLGRQLAAQDAGSTTGAPNLRDELPPHY